MITIRGQYVIKLVKIYWFQQDSTIKIILKMVITDVLLAVGAWAARVELLEFNHVCFEGLIFQKSKCSYDLVW